jgi:cytosine permease
MNDPGTRFIAEGYARETIPEAQLGGAYKLFFIVTGTLCGLPAYALSAQLANALGFEQARHAFLLGGLVSGALAALMAYVGAGTRMNVALLADYAFGTVGGRVVKSVLAFSLLMWATVILSVLGTTLGDAIQRLYGIHIAAPWIEAVAAIAIGTVTLRGVRGLESVGMIIAPVLAMLLAFTLYHGCGPNPGGLPPPAATIGLGAAISEVVGGNVVGILIQPDYARFVRRPLRAGIASALSLGVAYPAVLIFTALPAARCGAPNLIAVMVTAGIGVPALALLALGALIDGGASLYSGSLSLTNEVKKFRLPWVIVAAACVGFALATFHAERYYLPFLSLLGIAIPPVGAINILHVLLSRRDLSNGAPAERAAEWPACLGWIAGTLVGYLGTMGQISISGIGAVDSMAAAAIVWGVSRTGLMFSRKATA